MSEQEEIYGVKTIDWENDSWKNLSLIGDERVINLQRTKVYVFSDKVHQKYRALDRIDGEPIEFEWNIFPGFTTLQHSHTVPELLLRLNETPENFLQEGSSSCRCSMTSHGDQKITRENAIQMLNSFLFARRFGAGQWSFLGPGSEKKWYSISEDSPQGEWDKMAVKMMVTLAESGHPVFRATSPLSRGHLKSKGGGQLSIHYCADQDTITTVFFAQLLL